MAFGNKTASKSKLDLGAMIGETKNVKQNETTQICISNLKPFANGNQPFQMYDDSKKQELVESIKANGLLQPVIVRPMGDGYEILSGHNRVEACRELGMTDINAVIMGG